MNDHWLQLQFKNNPEKSKSGLARALGLEPPAVSKILNGERQIKAREYAIMRQYFGLPTEEQDSFGMHNYRIQNFGTALDLKDGAYAGSSDDWYMPASILQQKVSAPEKIKIFTIKDDLMAPDFKRHDTVLIDLSDRVPRETTGVYAISDGFSVMVRDCRIVDPSSALKIELCARMHGFTPTTLFLDDIKIIGRVVAQLQWL